MNYVNHSQKGSSTRSIMRSAKQGVSLIELTVVVVVIIALIGVLFLGAQAWLGGAQKSQCILIQRNYQQAIRSFQNINSLSVGADADLQDLADAEFTAAPSAGANPATDPDRVAHPGNATFQATSANDGLFNYEAETTVPTVGDVYLKCDSVADYSANRSDSETEVVNKQGTHQPLKHDDW